jgi:hypothetical protein
MSYDIIGDIHGEAGKLEALLRRLEYSERAGCWRHPSRTAVFVGDFIDRGPEQLKTICLVRHMVQEGQALAIMGNHEFNAIAWHTPDPDEPGEYLRPRFRGSIGSKNRKQHRRFLDEVEHDPATHADIISWFKTLPLWLELPRLRVVHACWHQRFMDYLAPKLGPRQTLQDALLVPATREPADKAEKDTPMPSVFKAAEALTKGIEMPLPEGLSFVDNDGERRDRVRVRWWDSEAETYRQAADLPDELRDRVPDAPTPPHARINVPTDRPIFFGHYWRTGQPAPSSRTLACVDYSAAKGGPLVAYRWDGEASLNAGHFVSAG